jgi:hypothetical protein
VLEAAQLGLDAGEVEERAEDAEDHEDRGAVEDRDPDVKALPQAEPTDGGGHGGRGGEHRPDGTQPGGLR